jgi:hypothetical protein
MFRLVKRVDIFSTIFSLDLDYNLPAVQGATLFIYLQLTKIIEKKNFREN